MPIDFSKELLVAVDAEAKRLNISRQAVIKTMVSNELDRRVRLRSKTQTKTKAS